MKIAIGILSCVLAPLAQATPPSAAAAYSCLSTRSVAPSVKWQQLAADVINSQDDYLDGFDATYYIVSAGKEIGHAKKGEKEAIIYGRKLFPLERAVMLDGFVQYQSTLDPGLAAWGTVADHSGNFLCISFPPNELAMSGSYQKYRSAYLLTIEGSQLPVLYFASGNIELFKPPSGSLSIGASFATTRTGLIKSGWKPAPVHRRHGEDVGTETRYVKKHFVEVDSCSMDMGSLCIFYYRKGPKCLRVDTVGEFGAMHVTTWENLCPPREGK